MNFFQRLFQRKKKAGATKSSDLPLTTADILYCHMHGEIAKSSVPPVPPRNYGSNDEDDSPAYTPFISSDDSIINNGLFDSSDNESPISGNSFDGFGGGTTDGGGAGGSWSDDSI